MTAKSATATPALFVISLIFLMLPDAGTSAQEFRIETDVLLGDEPKPVAQNLTLFTNGLVYDFPLVGREEITVFDAGRGRFVMLDVQRKVKTTVTTQHLLEYAAAVRVHAEKMDGAFAFAANPKFDQSFDEANGEVVLASEQLTYRAKGSKPKSDAVNQQYQQFADWYARLNGIRPGSLPPFARMELNDALAERGWIPEQVHLTVTGNDRLIKRRVELRSKHRINWRLSKTDRAKIEKAGDYMASFQSVSLSEYSKASGAASQE